jgi:hypothetical protein
VEVPLGAGVTLLVNQNGELPQARVFIAVPCQDQVQAMFAFSLAKMMAYASLSLVGPFQPVEWLRIMFVSGTLIAPQRRDLAASALKAGATHILWIDSDTTFPKDALNRLLARNKDYIGIVQSGRRPPFAPTAFTWENADRPTPVYVYPESTGIQRVDAIGFGLTLCRTEVFKQVQQPWFPIQWGHLANGEWAINGEDVGFQAWARKAGFELYVDLDLSRECGHVGSFEYRTDHALAVLDDLKDDPRFTVPDAPVTEYTGGKDLVPDPEPAKDSVLVIPPEMVEA